ncbi:MAG: ribosome small subunit-dependent GTPase A [Planctomycetes bacterium]|nr:ribosome small subunit-dependent GTPase A [Planctomycetota bacterium]
MTRWDRLGAWGVGKRKRQGKRVAFRQNRQQPGRRKDWTRRDQADPAVEDAAVWETVRAKGELSRKRTVAERAQPASPGDGSAFLRGTVIAVRGQFVEVDAGGRTWMCTVRRVLRTKLIEGRHPVVAGDQVRFAPAPESTIGQAVIEEVLPRRTTLHRSEGRRFHVIAANVEQVVIVSSIREPMIKPHLIDRYLVAVHAGGPVGLVCLNKVDLDKDGEADEILERYRRIGYGAVATSVPSGQGVEELRGILKDKITMLVGQSGVGKSSLINAIQPDLNLKVAHVSIATEKGRHTTTTAVWYGLAMGGAIIDTPGIRALDVAMVPLNELEAHFVEFVDRIPHCKYPNCVHIHEDGCAVKAAVEAGEIDVSRYESYVELFMDRSERQQQRR